MIKKLSALACAVLLLGTIAIGAIACDGAAFGGGRGNLEVSPVKTSVKALPAGYLYDPSSGVDPYGNMILRAAGASEQQYMLYNADSGEIARADNFSSFGIQGLYCTAYTEGDVAYYAVYDRGGKVFDCAASDVSVKDGIVYRDNGECYYLSAQGDAVQADNALSERLPSEMGKTIALETYTVSLSAECDLFIADGKGGIQAVSAEEAFDYNDEKTLMRDAAWAFGDVLFLQMTACLADTAPSYDYSVDGKKYALYTYEIDAAAGTVREADLPFVVLQAKRPAGDDRYALLFGYEIYANKTLSLPLWQTVDADCKNYCDLNVWQPNTEGIDFDGDKVVIRTYSGFVRVFSSSGTFLGGMDRANAAYCEGGAIYYNGEFYDLSGECFLSGLSGTVEYGSGYILYQDQNNDYRLYEMKTEAAVGYSSAAELAEGCFFLTTDDGALALLADLNGGGKLDIDLSATDSVTAEAVTLDRERMLFVTVNGTDGYICRTPNALIGFDGGKER